jgi:hypothetical protein
MIASSLRQFVLHAPLRPEETLINFERGHLIPFSGLPRFSFDID